jgi:cysteine-rich repeat protein
MLRALRHTLAPAVSALIAGHLAGCTLYDESLLLDAPPGVAGSGGGSGTAGSGGGAPGAGGAAGQPAAGGASGGPGGTGGVAGNAGGASGSGTGGGGSGGQVGPGGAGQGGIGGSPTAGGASGASGKGGSTAGGGGGGAPCTSDAGCDDQNPCTSDTCSGTCSHLPNDVAKPDAIMGNCHAEICMDGATASSIDDADVPADDGDPCTTSTCTDGTPGSKAAADGISCTVSGKPGQCQQGTCAATCAGASDCDDGNPCTEDVCPGPFCAHTPLPDNSDTPGVTDTPKDCKQNACVGGVDTVIPNDEDIPVDGNECTLDLCNAAGEPSNPAATNGIACNGVSGNICKNGQCLPNTCNDGIRAGTEACDTSDLGGKTCADYGFGNPAGLACNATCDDFVTTGCTAVCGNGTKEPGEACDEANSPAAAGDGCSQFCGAEPSSGDLVITEIMYNPELAATSGSAELGEWFEVYNRTLADIDLRGLKIVSPTSSSTDEVVITGAAPILVPSLGYVVLARSGDMTMNGGITPVFVYGNVNFSNSAADGVTLEIATPVPFVIDTVAYAPKATYTGKSRSLASTLLDAMSNDADASWCPAKTPYGAGDLGTPGQANPTCP